MMTQSDTLEIMQTIFPPKVLELDSQLYDLCNGAAAISIEEASPLIGVNPKTLRHSIYYGTCPFGIGNPPEKYAQGFGRVVTLPFYNFMTQGALYKFKVLSGTQFLKSSF